MSLWFELNVNSMHIGILEIRRQEPLDLRDQDKIQDAVSTYSVTLDGEHIGDVKHRYGDGAWRLVAIASELVAQRRALT